VDELSTAQVWVVDHLKIVRWEEETAPVITCDQKIANSTLVENEFKMCLPIESHISKIEGK